MRRRQRTSEAAKPSLTRALYVLSTLSTFFSRLLALQGTPESLFSAHAQPLLWRRPVGTTVQKAVQKHGSFCARGAVSLSGGR